MKFKVNNLILQLFFVILVVAVIATHVRALQKNELFENILGIVGSDENLKVTGKIMAISGNHQLGNSKIPDEQGDIHLTPTKNNNSIYMNGKTTFNNPICFTKNKNEQQCFDANTISTKQDVAKELQNIRNLNNVNNSRQSAGLNNVNAGMDFIAKGNVGNIYASKTLNSSRRCFDIPGGQTANGTRVTLWSCHNGLNQKFYHTPNKQIKSAIGNKCIHVPGDRNGTVVQIQDCNDNTINQKFDYDVATNAYIWNGNPRKCIDLPGGTTTNGTLLQISDCNRTDAQQFTKQYA